LPLTISTSYAFMLPVATPTNAVVFGTGYITIKDLFVSGLVLKVLGIFVLFFSTAWLQLIFADTLIIINNNYNVTSTTISQ
jgi:solute carrier family 13 (sodium-dependent dicarboxylate transporter), member 2/3/5